MSYCKWTKGCSAPGPWLAYIDGKWFECTDPEHADQSLYCAAHAREFQRLNIVNTITEDGESVRNPKASPLLLFCRRLVDTAIDDAKETDPLTGEPTDEAMLQRLWIEYRPDRGDREDFYGSFEWCCHWLSLEVEKTRADAIEEIEFTLARRLLAVKRQEFDRRKHDLLIKALSEEEQAVYRAARMAQTKRAQLQLTF